MTTRRYGRVIHHDPRSRAYTLTTVAMLAYGIAAAVMLLADRWGRR